MLTPKTATAQIAKIGTASRRIGFFMSCHLRVEGPSLPATESSYAVSARAGAQGATALTSVRYMRRGPEALV
jgi:hypothetical protein